MSSERNIEAVVVGGGIVGLSVSRALARDGIRVLLVERNELGRAATWAAGGMLSPLGEADGPGPFHEFCWASFERFPAFVSGVVAESGTEVGYLRSGKLFVAHDEGELDRLDHQGGWLRSEGHEARLLGPEIREEEPSLSRSAVGGLLVEADHQVDPRRLAGALRAAVGTAGVEILRAEVRRLELSSQGTQRVELTDGAVLSTERVILAAGAWSGEIEGLPRPLPVRPVRGQMAAVRGPHGYLDRMLARGHLYLIPRDDGTLVIGATEEEAGFQSSPTPAGVGALLRGAMELVPALAGFPLESTWAGLRPGTPDGNPFLGPDPDFPALIYATGHYRNGILLAPITAEWVRALVRGESTPLPAAPFRPDRFPFLAP